MAITQPDLQVAKLPIWRTAWSWTGIPGLGLSATAADLLVHVSAAIALLLGVGWLMEIGRRLLLASSDNVQEDIRIFHLALVVLCTVPIVVIDANNCSRRVIVREGVGLFGRMPSRDCVQRLSLSSCVHIATFFFSLCLMPAVVLLLGLTWSQPQNGALLMISVISSTAWAGLVMPFLILAVPIASIEHDNSPLRRAIYLSRGHRGRLACICLLVTLAWSLAFGSVILSALTRPSGNPSLLFPVIGTLFLLQGLYVSRVSIAAYFVVTKKELGPIYQTFD
jgi:hypothetical protein